MPSQKLHPNRIREALKIGFIYSMLFCPQENSFPIFSVILRNHSIVIGDNFVASFIVILSIAVKFYFYNAHVFIYFSLKIFSLVRFWLKD